MASSSCPQVLKHNWASSTSRFTATLNQGCLLQQGQEPAPLGHDSVGGTQTSPSFTEFSGFVLSALAMENLCFCMCACVGGVPVSHLLYSCTPQCLPCSGGAGVLLLPSPTTLPKICVCQWVGGQPVTTWGLCCFLSLGLSVLYGWLRRKVGKLSQPCR